MSTPLFDDEKASSGLMKWS